MHLARPLLPTSGLFSARSGGHRAFLLLHARSLGPQSYKPSAAGLASIQRSYSAQLKSNRPKDAEYILDDVELGARDWHYHHRLEGGRKSNAPVRELNRILKQDEQIGQHGYHLGHPHATTANQTFSQRSHGFHTSATQGFGHRSQDTHRGLQDDGNGNFPLPNQEHLKKAKDTLGESAQKASEKLKETTEEGFHKAAQFKDKVQETLGDTAEGGAQKAAQFKDKVQETLGETAEGGAQKAAQFKDKVQETLDATAEGGAQKAAELKDKLDNLNGQLADAYAAAKDNLIDEYEDAKRALDKEAESLKEQGLKPGQYTSKGVPLDTNDTYDIAKDNVIDPEQAKQNNQPSAAQKKR